MITNIPETTEKFGFITNGLGAHSSRTIMLTEIQMLLTACPQFCTQEDYFDAILKGNVLLKHTDSTRNESVRRLRELYGLSDHYIVFRALKDLWNQIPEAQPLLALSCALARDPVLRSSSQLILETDTDSMVIPQAVSKTIEEAFPSRFNETTLANFGRHLASSWTQSGHLKGRTKKIRSKAEAYPSSIAYALFLGYLTGVRGDALFETIWSRLLDSPLHVLHSLAAVASQRGWLEYRHAGNVTDITFRYLMREIA